MDFNAYQKKAHGTAIYPTNITLGFEDTEIEQPLIWIYPALGLTGESGELANKLKKIIRDANGEILPDIKVKLLDELGDILWYISELTTLLGAELEVVAYHNISKLSERVKRNVIKGSGDDR